MDTLRFKSYKWRHCIILALSGEEMCLKGMEMKAFTSKLETAYFNNGMTRPKRNVSNKMMIFGSKNISTCGMAAYQKTRTT